MTANRESQRSGDGVVRVGLKSVHQNYRHTLPQDLRTVKKFMLNLGLSVRTYDFCHNHCFLYYKDGLHLEKCPTCGDPRYEKTQGKEKPVARRKLWFFPLTERLQRLYMCRKTAEHMMWHAKCKRRTDPVIHPAGSEERAKMDDIFPDFAFEIRNVRLGLCTDGIDPHHGTTTKTHSIWPVLTRPWHLKDLWTHGVVTYDSFRKENFLMKGYLFTTSNDSPGYAMLSGCSTKGRLTCPCCMQNKDALWLDNSHKTCWFDNHMKFLPPNHPDRRNINDYIKGGVVTEPCPERIDIRDIYPQVVALPNVVFGKAKGMYVEFEGKNELQNWTKRNIFWELVYWSFVYVRHSLDVMHNEKNVFEQVHMKMFDLGKKLKDNLQSEQDLRDWTKRSELFIDDYDQTSKLKAAYTLDKEKTQTVCEWLQTLRFPDGHCSNLSANVKSGPWRITKMKSQDCHVFMQRRLPIALK